MKESFQNEKKLFIILEYCSCGNLTRILRKKGGKLTETQARNYICEIILAIGYLHQSNILYRYLKPENILIATDGHIKLTDFGLSKEIQEDFYNSNSFCGSHAYLAPEMLANRPHGKSIDWYGIGVVLYEFLVGVPPYFTNDPDRLYENIKSGYLKIPSKLSKECGHLISKLLIRNPLDRFGAREGFKEIKQHVWFKDVNWDEVYNKKIYHFKYKPKQLKNKEEKIVMEDLQVKESEKYKLQYKNKEIVRVEDWEFFQNI